MIQISHLQLNFVKIQNDMHFYSLKKMPSVDVKYEFKSPR